MTEEFDDLNAIATETEAGQAQPADAGAAAAATVEQPQGEQQGDAGSAEQASKAMLERVTKRLDAQRDEAARAAGKAPEDKKEGAAVDDPAKPGEGEAAKAAAKPEGEAKPDAKKASWISREDFKALPPNVQARVRELFGMQKTLNEKVGKAEARLAEVEPRAQNFEKLSAFLQGNKVEAGEFQWWLTAIQLAKTDPAKALEHLSPFVERLQTYKGERLPEDLAAKVEAGTLTVEDAKELAFARNERARLEAVAREHAERETQTTRERAANEQRTAVVRALDAYEKTWKAGDPDYPQKFEQTWATLRVMLDGKPAPTPEEAVAMLKQAREKVEKWMGGLKGKPPEIKPVGGGNGAGHLNLRREAQTDREAVRLALARLTAGHQAAA